MIKSKEIKEFMNKLMDTELEYERLIAEKEKGEMTFEDKNTVAIWEQRIDAINKMVNELEMLEFELFV